MQDNKSPVDKWVKKQIAHLRSVAAWRWVICVFLIALGVLFVSTAAEFLVAVHNRYSEYPSGMDTSMLAKSIGLSGVLSLAIAFLVGYVIKIVEVRWYWLAGFLLLSGLFCMAPDGDSWFLTLVIGTLALIVFGVTIGLSFKAKIPFLVLLLAFLIMLTARPSILPEDWCRYELTMYSCRVDGVYVP